MIMRNFFFWYYCQNVLQVDVTGKRFGFFAKMGDMCCVSTKVLVFLPKLDRWASVSPVHSNVVFERLAIRILRAIHNKHFTYLIRKTDRHW